MRNIHHLFIRVVLLSILICGCKPLTKTSTSVTSTPVEVTALPFTETPKATLPASMETWSNGDIETATKPEQCQSVSALPRTLKKAWNLGFIVPNLTHPFFVQRDAGMAAAAVFYGAKYNRLDAADGSSYNLLPDLLALNPDLIGSHNDVLSIALKAQKETIPFVSVDLMPSKYGLYPYGVPDATAGKLGGELLAQGLKERMSGETSAAAGWKDKELFFLGLTAKSIPACVTRTAAAAQAMKDNLGLDDAHTLILDPSEGGTSADTALLSVIKLHPEAVFGIIPCWDQLGIDPYKAAVKAGFESRILLVTLGGDKSNLEFLKTKPVGYYGVVEFQPYCEGWSWVETALAILEGVPFAPYQVSRTVTQLTVDERYAELYGTGK